MRMTDALSPATGRVASIFLRSNFPNKHECARYARDYTEGIGTHPIPTATRTFRVFVSSTFEDLKAERDALQSEVFPRLRKLCEENNARFRHRPPLGRAR